MIWLGIALIGLCIGFLSGLFGKGGSAIATPLLHAIGVPAIIAVAAPLPATIPSTLAAFNVYRKGNYLNYRVLKLSLVFGIPATIVGSIATRWIGGDFLVLTTDVIVALLGLRFLLAKKQTQNTGVVEISDWKIILVSIVVGLVSGLLANSGGFLLAPLYIAILKLPIKSAFATSLAVASVLAVPGTIVHTVLGHIDWKIVLVFGSMSIPFANIGARTAVKIDAHKLEKIFGIVLLILGVTFIFLH